MRTSFNERLEKGISLYLGGMPLLKAAPAANVSSCALSIHLRKRGLSRSNKINSRKFKVNHRFFEKINTEQKAYWFGFLCADGYITRGEYGNYVGVTLHEREESHLETFKTHLESDYPLKYYTSKSFGVPTPVCRLLICSREMFCDLKRNGLPERKSLILKFPSKIPNHLIHHFIRGYFDGDGSFAKNNNGYRFSVCGTKQLLNKLSRCIGFPARHLNKRHKDKRNNYSLDISGRLQVVSIGKYMYKNATIYLERKYVRYLELLK